MRIGPAGGESKVSRPLLQSQVLRLRLRIRKEFGQPQVHLASPACGRQRGGRLGEQRVSEAQAVSLGAEDAGDHRLFQSRLVRRLLDHGAGRLAEERGSEHSLTARAAQALDPPPGELLDVVGYRKGLVYRKRLLVQDPADLEGEEGIAPASVVQPAERRPLKGQSELGAEQAMGRSEAEWSRAHAPQSVTVRAVEPEGNAACLVRPSCQKQRHRFVAEPAGDEREHVGRVMVEPLHVVDRHEERALHGERTQRTEHRHGDRTLVRRRPRHVGQQQRHFERAFLRRR